MFCCLDKEVAKTYIKVGPFNFERPYKKYVAKENAENEIPDTQKSDSAASNKCKNILDLYIHPITLCWLMQYLS